MRRDSRCDPGETQPTCEGSCASREMPEVQLEGVRRRGARLRHLDGLERVEPLPHPIPHGPGLLRRELSHLSSPPGPRDRPDVALLHNAQIMARAEVEAVPSRLHSRTRPRRPRSRDASHPGERDRPVASDQAARRRRDPALRRGRDAPGGPLPDQRGKDRRRREVRHETLERRALHLVVRGARGRKAPALRRMDPRGAEPARRIMPRGPRGPGTVPPGEPGSGLPLEPVCPALRGDGEGPRVRGRHGRSMDAARVSAGSPAPPRAGHAVLDGQDLAVRVRRERARGAIPDAAGRHPRLPGGLHGRTPRLQRGRLEAETGPGPLAERRTPRSRNPSELEAVRRGPEADAPPRVRSTRMTVDPDRLSGALICTGAVVGLVGSIATMSVFLGVPSFALVLLLGVYAFRKRKEGRLLAAAVVWFAALGALGGFPPFFSRFYGLLPTGYYWLAAIPILGTALAIAGAVVKLLLPRRA